MKPWGVQCHCIDESAEIFRAFGASSGYKLMHDQRVNLSHMRIGTEANLSTNRSSTSFQCSRYSPASPWQRRSRCSWVELGGAQQEHLWPFRYYWGQGLRQGGVTYLLAVTSMLDIKLYYHNLCVIQELHARSFVNSLRLTSHSTQMSARNRRSPSKQRTTRRITRFSPMVAV